MNIREVFNYEQKDIEVNGKTYKVQAMPFKLIYQMQERCRDKNGNILPSKLYDEIFEKVIISPKIGWDNFESLQEIEELMEKIMLFLTDKKPFKKEEIELQRED